jgi:DNA repair exonuclease SbcCD ATPase subunit
MDDQSNNLQIQIDNLQGVIDNLNQQKSELNSKIIDLKNQLQKLPEYRRKNDLRLKSVVGYKKLISKIDKQLQVNTKLKDKLVKQINSNPVKPSLIQPIENRIGDRIQQFGKPLDDSDSEAEAELNRLFEESEKNRLEEEQKRISRSLEEEEQMRLEEENQRLKQQLIDDRNKDLFGENISDDFTSNPKIDEELNNLKLQKEEERKKNEQALKIQKMVRNFQQTKKRKQMNQRKTRKNTPDNEDTFDSNLVNPPSTNTNSINSIQTPSTNSISSTADSPDDSRSTITSRSSLNSNFTMPSINSNNSIQQNTTYSDTLIKNVKQPQVLQRINVNSNTICPSIFKMGKNVTKKYYFPSEFPNLTNIKNIKGMIPPLKGGYRRKTRKMKKL